jgi:uncharacterized protein
VSRWRILLVVALVGMPFAFLAVAGSYYLWFQTRYGFWVWWGIAGCMSLGYGLGLYWQRKNRLLRPPESEAPLLWTDRDRQAWQLVQARAAGANKLSAEQMASLQTYVDTAQEMALELARYYHPRAADPVGDLTIPEILAVVELASQDMGELVDQYLPGGHLLTVNNWKQAQKATEWYATANTLYWAVSALFAPVSTAVRYAASRYGVSKPWQMLQQNLLVWFYTAYVHRLGTYLIDLHGGRLRVGARRFRELTRQPSNPDGSPRPADPAEAVRAVTITLMGQVKAGKSSTINALLGEQRARTDVLPATNEITRYELQPAGVPTKLALLDTAGYGHAGPRADQLRATQEAARGSELILLVMHARNPARQADLEALRGLKEWFAAHPDLKMPPVLGVLTHVDLLSPAMEWAPPYDWQNPKRPKELQIQMALAAVHDHLGPYLTGCVPLCVAEGRVYGVQEWLLPTVVELLGEAQSVGLLRCLHAEADANKIRRVLQQLLAAGGQVAAVALAGYNASKRPAPTPPVAGTPATPRP